MNISFYHIHVYRLPHNHITKILLRDKQTSGVLCNTKVFFYVIFMNGMYIIGKINMNSYNVGRIFYFKSFHSMATVVS